MWGSITLSQFSLLQLVKESPWLSSLLPRFHRNRAILTLSNLEKEKGIILPNTKLYHKARATKTGGIGIKQTHYQRGRVEREPRSERPETALEPWPATCKRQHWTLPYSTQKATQNTTISHSKPFPSAFLLHRKLLLTFSSLTGTPQPALRTVTAPLAS